LHQLDFNYNEFQTIESRRGKRGSFFKKLIFRGEKLSSSEAVTVKPSEATAYKQQTKMKDSVTTESTVSVCSTSTYDEEQENHGKAVVRVLAHVLERMVKQNEQMTENKKDDGNVTAEVTKYQALKAPGISVYNYLERIRQYANCSSECFILALIYIDRLIQSQEFRLTSLNIHRVILTSVLLAAKFFDDKYYNNAYYAKVGGVINSEMNGLEVDFLFRINFSLYVKLEVFDKYQGELISHAVGAPVATPTLQAESANAIQVVPNNHHVPTATTITVTEQQQQQQQQLRNISAPQQLPINNRVTPSPSSQNQYLHSNPSSHTSPITPELQTNQNNNNSWQVYVSPAKSVDDGLTLIQQQQQQQYYQIQQTQHQQQHNHRQALYPTNTYPTTVDHPIILQTVTMTSTSEYFDTSSTTSPYSTTTTDPLMEYMSSLGLHHHHHAAHHHAPRQQHLMPRC